MSPQNVPKNNAAHILLKKESVVVVPIEKIANSSEKEIKNGYQALTLSRGLKGPVILVWKDGDQIASHGCPDWLRSEFAKLSWNDIQNSLNICLV
jgi:hypothetical protein